MTMTNPNSNLVFDFPDPTPRFEFDDWTPTLMSKKKMTKRTKKGLIGGVDGGGGGGIPIATTPMTTSRKGGAKRIAGLFTKRGPHVGGGGGTNDSSSLASSSTMSNSPGGSTSTRRSCCDLSSVTHTTTTTASMSSFRSRSEMADIIAGDADNDGNSFKCFFDTPADPASTGVGVSSVGIGVNGGQSTRTRPPSFTANGAANASTMYSSYLSASESVTESEFSFDRVTVTTNETGYSNSKMSSVDWDFLDNTNNSYNNGQHTPYASAAGGGQQRSVKHTASSTAAAATPERVAVTSRGAAGRMSPPDIQRQQQQQLHACRITPATTCQEQEREQQRCPPSPPPSSLTLAILELPNNDAHYDENHSSPGDSDVPAVYHQPPMCRNESYQSVISEISERTGAFSIGDTTPPNEAVRVLLQETRGDKDIEKLSATKERQANGISLLPFISLTSTPSYCTQQQHRTIQNNCQAGVVATTKTRKMTTPTTTMPVTTGKSLLEDIQSNYAIYRASSSSRYGNKQEGQEKWKSLLDRIVEDVQFCGWFLCGMDTTVHNNKEEEKNFASTL